MCFWEDFTQSELTPEQIKQLTYGTIDNDFQKIKFDFKGYPSIECDYYEPIDYDCAIAIAEYQNSLDQRHELYWEQLREQNDGEDVYADSGEGRYY